MRAVQELESVAFWPPVITWSAQDPQVAFGGDGDTGVLAQRSSAINRAVTILAHRDARLGASAVPPNKSDANQELATSCSTQDGARVVKEVKLVFYSST